MQLNPIAIVEDDEENLVQLREVIATLDPGRPVLFFTTGNALIDHIKANEASPFLIICEVNLPGEDGFALKKRMTEDPDLKYQSVPFLFWTNGASERQIQFAYDLPAQGFFFKPHVLGELRETVKTILDYWHKSQHPKRIR